ncbi:MAG: hypothetical protein WAM14_26960 [Candidatus Nitrosopolaris sp.]
MKNLFQLQAHPYRFKLVITSASYGYGGFSTICLPISSKIMDEEDIEITMT